MGTRREAARRTGPRIEAAALALAAALAAAGAARFVALDIDNLGFPYAVNYGEGVVLDQARRIAEGPGLYGPIDRPPYIVDNYTPLHPWLASLLLPATGPSFFGGRTISFLSAFLAGACLLALVRPGGRDPRDRIRRAAAGLVAAGLYVASREAIDWCALFRVDALGVALSLAGLLVAAGRLRAGPILAAPIFLASLATRQSLVAAPIAGYVAAFLRDRRRGLLGAAALAALLAAGAIAGSLATEGRFLAHIVRYNAIPFDASSLWTKYFEPMLAGKAPLLAAALLAGVVLGRDEASLPLRILAPVALILALSIGRKGSDVNYLLVPIASLAALAGRGIARAPRAWQRIAIAGLAAAQLALGTAMGRPRIGAVDREEIAARDRAVLRTLARLDGPVLFEEPSLAVLSGRPLLHEPFMTAQLAGLGLWDPAPLIEAVRARRYAAVQRTAIVVGSTPRSPARRLWIGDRSIPAVREALEEAYAPGMYRFARRIRTGAAAGGAALYESFSLWFPKEAKGGE